MSLTNRFSTLLLVTLGLTLAGFSTALFVTSRAYLNRQVDDRLAAILTLLNSSADTKRGWVRWDARQKRLPPSRWNERHATTWLVFDAERRVLTRPRHPAEDELPHAWIIQASTGTLPGQVTDNKGRTWRVGMRRLLSDPERAAATERPTDTSEGKSYHDHITLAAFAALDDTELTLRTLGWLLFGISLLIWTFAALCARWLSRQTLVPLTRLVQSVQSLDASQPGWTLTEPGSGDELDDLARAFNALLTRLHEAYDRQRRFSSEASHQLRTPVAVMIGHLEVAQRQNRSGEEYRRTIQLAHRRAVEFGQIVESLLFLSRADSSTLTRSERLDLGRWLTTYMNNRPVGPRSCDISVHGFGHGSLWIEAQPLLLGQLVENLLDNASKYSPPGTPIDVAVARDDGLASLSVADSGRGIAAEDLPRVFEPFFRSAQDSSQRVPGVGLGLAVVQRIATAFGGAVAVESELGHGSRFEVRFPLVTDPYPESNETAPSATSDVALSVG
jgi:signal transduction histidine kinase